MQDKLKCSKGEVNQAVYVQTLKSLKGTEFSCPLISLVAVSKLKRKYRYEIGSWCSDAEFTGVARKWYNIVRKRVRVLEHARPFRTSAMIYRFEKLYLALLANK